MRTLNVKAAVILVIVVIIVAGSTHLLHSFQVFRHSSTLKDRAVAAWNEKPRRDEDALRYMKDYLGFQPKDFEAVQRYADWLVEVNRCGPAAMTLEELVRNLEKEEPPDAKLLSEVRRRLAAIWMDKLQNWRAAQAHLKVLLQNYPVNHPEQLDSEGAELVWRLGYCYSKQAKDKDAIDCYKRALANDANKGHVEYYYHMACTLLYLQGNVDAARKCMADMIAAKPNAQSPHAHSIYALWLEELGDIPAALEQNKIVLKLKEDFPVRSFTRALAN